jgi:hypothetical protein
MVKRVAIAIWQWIRLRIQSCIGVMGYRPNLTAIVVSSVIFVGGVIKYRQYLFTHIPLWSQEFGNYVLHLAQNHPHLSRILHVILNAVPDAVPLFLGIAGLVYLMPNLAKKIEDSKPLRVSIATLCILFCFLAIAVNAINREAQEHTGDEQNTRLETVERTNDQILKAVLNPSPNVSVTSIEQQRRTDDVLRNKYILTHPNISPEILAGTAWPPTEWMNQQLASLHAPWKFTESSIKNRIIVQQVPIEPKKAHVVFGFYQVDPHSDNLQTASLDPMQDSIAKFSITAMVTGDVTAEDLHIWIRECITCSWVSVPPGFVAPDKDHDSDRELSLPKMEPNIGLGKWDFSVSVPRFPRYDDVAIACYYACENCETVDPKKPQRLYLTKNPTNLAKLQFSPPSISDTPERVH